MKKDTPASSFYPISQDTEPLGPCQFEWDTTSKKWVYQNSWIEPGYKWWSFSPDGLRLAKVREESKYYIQIFDSKTGQLLSEHLGKLPLSVKPVIIMYNPQGTRIFSSFEDGTVKIFNSQTGEEINSFKYNNGVISSARFSSDGNYLVIGTVNGNILLYGK